MTNGPVAGQGVSVWDRLRRRKVVQWGIAYAAGAWGLQQGVAYVSGLLHWSEQLQRLSGLALLLGLPVALVLAWYHGDKEQQRVTRAEFAILIGLFLSGGGLFWYYQHAAITGEQREAVTASTGRSTDAIATDRSIAVLPFVNMSSDKEQEFFADGISEELLNLLAQVPQLRVIARTSSFSFKGREVDIATIARTLNVANVLEGSVRKSGDTIRITAQLIRASDSSHLWSQTYDRKLTDVFKVQDEIAAAVVEQLKIALLETAPKSHATDPQAYALFLQARETMRQYTTAAFTEAAALYRQALAIDPAYAPAWDGLAEAHFAQVDFGVLTLKAGIPLAREAARRALTSDPRYAPAYAHAALVEGVLDADGLPLAARYLEQGQAVDPVSLDVAEAAVRIARRLGRLDESTAFAEYVVARDPISVVGRESLANAYWLSGRLDDAAVQFRKLLELSPSSSAQHMQLGEVLLQKGEIVEALAEFQQEPDEMFRLPGLAMAYHSLGRKSESDAALTALIAKYRSTMAYNIAYVYAWRGEAGRAFEWLDYARENGDSLLSVAPFDSLLSSLHADPRWVPYLRRLGKTPEQLAAVQFNVKVPN